MTDRLHLCPGGYPRRTIRAIVMCTRLTVAVAFVVRLVGCGASAKRWHGDVRTVADPSARWPKVVLGGCHRLPYSVPQARRVVLGVYRIDGLPDRVCFRFRGSSYKSQAPGQEYTFGDPWIDSYQPRPADYWTQYEPPEHPWLLTTVDCPC